MDLSHSRSSSLEFAFILGQILLLAGVASLLIVGWDNEALEITCVLLAFVSVVLGSRWKKSVSKQRGTTSQRYARRALYAECMVLAFVVTPLLFGPGTALSRANVPLWAYIALMWTLGATSSIVLGFRNLNREAVDSQGHEAVDLAVKWRVLYVLAGVAVVFASLLLYRMMSP